MKSGVRVLRLLEYEYESVEAMEQDMSRWLPHSPPGNKRMRFRSTHLLPEAIEWSRPEVENAVQAFDLGMRERAFGLGGETRTPLTNPILQAAYQAGWNADEAMEREGIDP